MPDTPEKAKVETASAEDVQALQEQINDMHGRFNGIENAINSLAPMIEQVAVSLAPEPEPEPAPVGASLPPGATRFFCLQWSAYQIRYKPKASIVDPGTQHVHIIPERWIQFTNHIYTTADEGEQEFLRGRILAGETDFIEDPDAVGRTVPIQTGVKSMGKVVQPDRPPAPLAAAN